MPCRMRSGSWPKRNCERATLLTKNPPAVCISRGSNTGSLEVAGASLLSINARPGEWFAADDVVIGHTTARPIGANVLKCEFSNFLVLGALL